MVACSNDPLPAHITTTEWYIISSGTTATEVSGKAAQRVSGHTGAIAAKHRVRIGLHVGDVGVSTYISAMSPPQHSTPPDARFTISVLCTLTTGGQRITLV